MWDEDLYLLSGLLLGCLVVGGIAAACFRLVKRRRRAAGTEGRLAYRGLRTADQIDEYHIVRRIHDGLNSQVWEVFDEVAEEHLVMKSLADDRAADQKLCRALRHEWEVGRKLKHPNLIRFRRHVGDEWSHYIIMELFPSTNLKKRILGKQHEFLTRHARGIMKQTAKALAYMHARGWVHRDIKPANILVSDDGDVRLIDFGLAEPVLTGWRRFLRRRRGIQGTLSYLSPEQVRGECVDDRSDIYCLGATFYELVTGRPPLVGRSPGELLSKHLSERPASPQVYNPTLTTEFAALVQWMLEKKPEQRPPEVNVVLLRLRETALFRAQGPLVEN